MRRLNAAFCRASTASIRHDGDQRGQGQLTVADEAVASAGLAGQVAKLWGECRNAENAANNDGNDMAAMKIKKIFIGRCTKQRFCHEFVEC